MIPLVCRYIMLKFEELEPLTRHGLIISQLNSSNSTILTAYIIIIYAVRLVLVLEFNCSQTETVPNHHGHLKICY